VYRTNLADGKTERLTPQGNCYISYELCRAFLIGKSSLLSFPFIGES
jgi:hypothetical protein